MKSMFNQMLQAPRYALIAMTVVTGVGASMVPSSEAHAETMTERCSGDVHIVRNYNDGPNAPGAIILKRNSRGWSNVTGPFTVNTSRNGHIRWWCKSTKGNPFDLGTYRIKRFHLGTKCDYDFRGAPRNCRPVFQLRTGTSARDGFTPERSRCGSRSNRLVANLGPKRAFWMVCK